jgi:hypothetical protein
LFASLRFLLAFCLHRDRRLIENYFDCPIPQSLINKMAQTPGAECGLAANNFLISGENGICGSSSSLAIAILRNMSFSYVFAN